MNNTFKDYGEASRLNVLRYLTDEFDLDWVEANKVIDRNKKTLARGIVEDWSATNVGDRIMEEETA